MIELRDYTCNGRVCMGRREPVKEAPEVDGGWLLWWMARETPIREKVMSSSDKTRRLSGIIEAGIGPLQQERGGDG
jgi:hypothetical protein